MLTLFRFLSYESALLLFSGFCYFASLFCYSTVISMYRFRIFQLYFSRACLKKAFREMRVPVCGRFYPNEGGVAGYGNRMRVKYTAKWGLQIAEMIFQTRSSCSCNFLCVLILFDILPVFISLDNVSPSNILSAPV